MRLRMSGDCPTIGDLMTGRALLPALLMGEGVFCEMELQKGLQSEREGKLFEKVNFHSKLNSAKRLACGGAQGRSR